MSSYPGRRPLGKAIDIENANTCIQYAIVWPYCNNSTLLIDAPVYVYTVLEYYTCTTRVHVYVHVYSE